MREDPLASDHMSAELEQLALPKLAFCMMVDSEREDMAAVGALSRHHEAI